MAALDSHEAAARVREDRIRKFAHEVVVSIVSAADPASGPLCIKEQRHLGIVTKLKNLLRRPAGRRAWVNLLRLRVHGINVPEGVALVERRRLGVTVRSYLITRAIERAETIDRYVLRVFSQADPSSQHHLRRSLVDAAAAFCRTIHETYAYHRDWKSTNILIREKEGAWEFFLVDVDRVQFGRLFLSSERKLRNLAQLNASIPKCITWTDRLRFYKAYRMCTKLTEEDKECLRKILAVTYARFPVWLREGGTL